MHPSLVDRLATDPAELDEPALDTFAEKLAARFKAEAKLSEKRAHSIAVEVAREVFDDAAPASDPKRAWDEIIGILVYLSDSATPGVVLDAICHCLGLLQKGELSMDSLAQKHGVSRQAFSKVCLRCVRDLRLPVTNGMRPAEKRQAYKVVQRSRWAELEQDRLPNEQPIPLEIHEHETECPAKSKGLLRGRPCPTCGK